MGFSQCTPQRTAGACGQKRMSLEDLPLHLRHRRRLHPSPCPPEAYHAGIRTSADALEVCRRHLLPVLIYLSARADVGLEPPSGEAAARYALHVLHGAAEHGAVEMPRASPGQARAAR